MTLYVWHVKYNVHSCVVNKYTTPIHNLLKESLLSPQSVTDGAKPLKGAKEANGRGYGSKSYENLK